MGVFERFLSVWVFLGILVGVLLGMAFPQVMQLISSIEVAHVNIPIAILIWCMIFPMMIQVDFNGIGEFKKFKTGLVITVIMNWIVKPLTMALLAWFFFSVLYKSFLDPSLAKEYIAGAIILGAAPCTAMVFVWSSLTKGNANYTLAQVGINDLILPIAFIPIVQLLVGINGIILPWNTLVLSVVLYVLVPFALGYYARKIILNSKGEEWLVSSFMPKLKPVGIIGLILTLVLLFAFQSQSLILNWWHIVLIAIPLTIQTLLIFAITWKWGRSCKLSHDLVAPSAFIGASNFFELAVAVAISVFGLYSGAALATVVGVLIEVPLMLALVKYANLKKY